jgi:hypothetical protein
VWACILLRRKQCEPFLSAKQTWQVARCIDDPHHFDAFGMKLVEDKPPLVLEVAPPFGRCLVLMARFGMSGLLLGAVTYFFANPTRGLRTPSATRM